MEDRKTIKIALAQTHIVWEDKEANYRKAEELVSEAAAHGTGAVFFPEMSFTGFSMNTDATKESGGETVSYMGILAKKYGVAVGFGWVKDCGARCENHYTVTDEMGAILSDYVKIHPFSYAGEEEWFQGGGKLTFFALKGILCSSFICYDLRFPEIFQIASQKADVIIVPANWPARRGSHWKVLLQARAIENQAYIAAVNCVGRIGGTDYAGDSCVVAPDGEIRAELSGAEGLVYYELADDVQRFRDAFPVKRDRREELYELLRK